jgi:vacuolar-type H+-ATPase subunit H
VEIKDVIERMLSVEKDARALLAEAEREAERIADQGRRQAAELREARLADARADAAETLQKADQQAQEQRLAALAAGEQEIRQRLGRCEDRKAEAVRLVADALLGAPEPREAG